MIMFQLLTRIWQANEVVRSRALIMEGGHFLSVVKEQSHRFTHFLSLASKSGAYHTMFGSDARFLYANCLLQLTFAHREQIKRMNQSSKVKFKCCYNKFICKILPAVV